MLFLKKKILLHKEDCKYFAVTVPKISNSGPADRYDQRVVSPQSIANRSPFVRKL